MEKVSRDLFLSYLEELHSDAKCALDYTNDYELLISIILSAQTTDKSVNKVTPLLFSKYPTIEALSKADIKDVETIIKEIGLYKNKAKNVINACSKLREDGYLKIPNNFDYLISLDGVGRKTANVFLAEYYNENTLGVDTHILRVSKRLRITPKDGDALVAERKLKSFVKDYNYKKLHHLIITFGRNECQAKNPKCDNCKLRQYCIDGVKNGGCSKTYKLM